MKKIILILLSISSILTAQQEFLVNTYMDSTQRAPVIASDIYGGYLIVWQSFNESGDIPASRIVGKFFDNDDQPIGDEFNVGSEFIRDQTRPSVALGKNGSNYAITWAQNSKDAESNVDVYAYFHSVYSLFTGRFKVNTTDQYSQTKPAVDISEDLKIVFVWESWYQDGSNKGVYAKIFDENSSVIKEEFLVNTTTQYSQGRPSVKYLSNGNFIVIWESWKQDVATPSGYGLYGKIFNGNGEVVKDEFRINTYTNDYQWFGDIAATNDGGFVVTWCSWEQDGDDGGIYIRKYDAAGNELTNEQLVNKTTVKYQWLPKVNEMPDGKIGVVWSSWRQDGSREGVYAKLLHSDLTAATFETQVNDYTDSYQWEPDFIPAGIDEMVVTWSSWGQYDNDYEVMAKRIKLSGPQGVIGSKTYEHSGGNSTSRFYVHVIDSTQLTGNEYELSFSSVADESAVANVTNLTTGEAVVTGFPVDKGEGIFYLTPEFEGAAVEIQPNFTFDLDRDRSFFVNNSGTNLTYTIGPGFGSAKLAPIDIALIWGSADTLADGTYSEPLDYAYNSSGTKVVACPFYAWSVTDKEKVDLVILEPTYSNNLKWEPHESVGFLTPAKYEPNFPQYHASLSFTAPSENLVMPSAGDTSFIFTKRPLTAEDKFVFKTDKAYITTDAKESSLTPNEFKLYQNYPNPFNPTTTIEYQIPALTPPLSHGERVSEGRVRVILQVFDILGREVATIVDKQQKPGTYKILFDASQLSSGVYLYSIRYSDKAISKKMLLIK